MRDDLAALFENGRNGDETAYRRALDFAARRIRVYVSSGFRIYGYHNEDVEDVVQETLLTIHLKRQTWDASRPIEPWLKAIARNKLVDHLRRKGYRKFVPLDDVAEILACSPDNVYVRLHRALARLRAELAQEMPVPAREVNPHVP